MVGNFSALYCLLNNRWITKRMVFLISLIAHLSAETLWNNAIVPSVGPSISETLFREPFLVVGSKPTN